MKKKIVIKLTLIVAILAVAGIEGMIGHSNQNSNGKFDLLTQNIEALSWEEQGGSGSYIPPSIGTEICDDSHVDYCYRIGTRDYTESTYYDSDKKKWFKTERYYLYTATTTLYYCLHISALEAAYYEQHHIPYSDCIGKKTSCDTDEFSTIPPEGLPNYWVTETHECPSPYM